MSNKNEHGGCNCIDRLLSQVEVSEILCVSQRTLEYWRSNKNGGPKYTKIGKLARYRISDVREYIEQLAS